ncbi:unnamed protein product [Camellia sinensis]
MNEEQEKRESRTTTTTTPFIQLGQVDSDFALALSLQEQERAFTMLPTVESDREENEEGTASEEEEEEEEDDQNEDYFDEDDAAFFLSQDIDAELAFSEGEDSNDYQMEEMEEDDVDPDELSYEELIALGETVGEENRGLSAEEISSCLSPYTRLPIDSKTTIDRCVICQVEYEEGEKLVALPCEHPYHSDCVSQWLLIKKVCPICNTEVSISSSNIAN